MAKAKPKKKAPAAPRRPGPGWHLAKTAVKATLALVLAFGLLVGVARLGEWTGAGVASQSRYTVPFADIDVPAAPGRDRPTFLTEVRFLNDLPETLQSVDPQLAEKLTSAFRKHPWVLDVNGVSVEAQGRIRVDVKFREPALAVHIGSEKDPRVLDRTGVLLPSDASPAKLPSLVNRVVPTNTAVGQKWPDPDVQRAVELVALHPCERIERHPDAWLLTHGATVKRIALH